MKFSSDKIENLEISFLLPLAAYPPTYMSPEEVCHLLRDIEINGILEPAILSINPFTKMIRLDSGNHRVRILPIIGITQFPTTTFVSNIDIPSPGNGIHLYKTDLIKYDRKKYQESFYCKPSEVLDFGDCL